MARPADHTPGLIDTGAAASLVSANILYQLKGKSIRVLKNDEDTPTFQTVLGQELHSLGKYEFPVTIKKTYFSTQLLQYPPND